MSKKSIFVLIALFSIYNLSMAQDAEKISPIFKDGEAQIVPAFEDDNDWIVHDLWVETEFDSDGDGQMDRMHVSVTRPKQTQTEDLKLPVIYISSPYFAGVAPDVEGLFWLCTLHLLERDCLKARQR